MTIHVDELRHLRRVAADEIERLIAFLDATDGDPDVELNGDELDFGTQLDTGWGPQWRNTSPHQNEDDEDTHDAEATNEDGGDILDVPHDEDPPEANLGSLERIDQRLPRMNSDPGVTDGEVGASPSPKLIRRKRKRRETRTDDPRVLRNGSGKALARIGHGSFDEFGRTTCLRMFSV